MYSTHVSSSFSASAHSIRGIAVLRLRPLSMSEVVEKAPGESANPAPSSSDAPAVEVYAVYGVEPEIQAYAMLGLVLLSLGTLSLAQDKVFDWVRASDEVSQLDPADYHAGRVYRPGADGGGMHVDIQARRPVTIAMAFASDWNAWQQHPESQAAPEFRCLREHVTSTTYECHMPPNRPMVLLIRDERTPDRAILTGIGVVLGRGAPRQFISPNEVMVTYYSWTCVQNCIQAEFQWFSLVKEKYELTSVPKIYSLLTPERDGQQVNVRVKAPIPMKSSVSRSK